MEKNATGLDGAGPLHPGLRLMDGGVECAVWSHNAETIWFCQFDGEREVARWRLCARNDDIHHGFVPGVTAGARYGLRADGPWAPERGHRFDPLKLLVDPRATRLDRCFGQRPELALPRALAVAPSSRMTRPWASTS